MTGAAISSNAKHAIAFMVIIGCVFQFVVWLTAVSAFGSEEPEQATPVAASTAPTTEAPEPAPTPTETTEAPKPEPTKPKATEPPKPKPAPVKLYRVTSVLDGDTVDLSTARPFA
jgi:cytoskeletal protein RodZ